MAPQGTGPCPTPWTPPRRARMPCAVTRTCPEPPTFRVLPGRGAPGAEGLPGTAAVPEAPALGHLAGAVLQALVGAGRPPHGLPLGGPLPLGGRAAGAGEDTVFQTDLLTAPGGRTDGQTDTHRETAGEVTLAPVTCCRLTPAHGTDSDPAPERRAEGRPPRGGRRPRGRSAARGGRSAPPQAPGRTQEPSLAGRWSVDPQVAFGCARRGWVSPLSCCASLPQRHPRQTGPKVPRG